MSIDASKHCVIAFGSYVQTHEQHDNTMIPRKIVAIALRPTRYVQGGHYFYSLQTGRRINRNKWTKVPMPADVTPRVHKMAKNQATIRLVLGDRLNIEPRDEELMTILTVTKCPNSTHRTQTALATQRKKMKLAVKMTLHPLTKVTLKSKLMST